MTVERSDCYGFASRWLMRFRDPDLTPDLQDQDFPSELTALGSGPAAPGSSRDAAIRHLLSALGTRWEQLAATGADGPPDDSWQTGFCASLERLARLADPSRFSGKPQSMYLVSQAAVFLEPEENAEIEQRFRLHRDGRASLSRYACSGDLAAPVRISSLRFHIDPELACDLLAGTAKLCRSPEHWLPIRDLATWDLKLTNTAGTVYSYQASPAGACLKACQQLSDCFRDGLDREDLLLFDIGGKAERIERIRVDYRRTAAGAADYTESLVLDRKAGQLVQRQQQGDRVERVQKFTAKGQLRCLLDSFDPAQLFGVIAGNPADVAPLPQETREYRIAIDYRRGPARALSGSFDQKGLPEDWDDFAAKIRSFMNSCEHDEVLHPGIYGKKRRRHGELVFLSVVFPSSGKRYSYLGDDSVREGDFVLVPAGEEGRELPAEVVRVDYCQPADAPYPLEKTRRMIRRLSDEEW